MAPFYGWGSTVSRLEPLLGGSLLFTTKFPEVRLNKNVKSSHRRCSVRKGVLENVANFTGKHLY